jgi:glycerol-3-phosphate acyltransferase PlsY
MVNEIIALVLGYLVGSIPAAYLATRIASGGDIRRLGGGNVGGYNTFREVGLVPALVVGVVDVGKGAAAVAIAYWLLDVSPLFVMLAGFAAVVGHNWMLFLKFSGGKGMASVMGALAVLLPVYGYWMGLIIVLGVILIGLVITRNVTLSLALGMVALLFISIFMVGSLQATFMTVAVGVLVGLRFLPTARAAWARAGGIKSFVFTNIRGRKPGS